MESAELAELSRERFGPFQLQGAIGRGSLGRVFAARHVESGEALALKWIAEPDSVPRLKREFRVARALRHPNLVQLHELHERSEGAFFTMERVTGPDVVARCALEGDDTDRVTLARALFADLADALAYLHAGGLVHGDLKPANVLVAEGDRPVLLDFELAHRGDAGSSSGFSGTYVYAAPELLHGERASASSDWFAFGVLFFEALAGQLPFGGDPARTTTAWFNGRRVESAAMLPPAARDLAPLLDQLTAPTVSERAGAHEVFRQLGAPRRWVRAPELLERATATRALSDRLGRPGARVAVAGAPGLGKTRLVRETIARLGLPTLSGVCHPREHVAFNALDGPIHQLAAWGRRATRPALVRALGANASAKTNLGALAAAFVTVAHEVSEGPLVLFIDGAHWADPDSASLLVRIHSMAKAVALDLRQVVTTHGNPAALPPALRANGGGALRLEPLTRSGSEALLQAVEPGIQSDERSHLVELCAGNPLLLERAALWHRERGASSDPPRTMAELSLSTSPRATGAQRALLELLAVHGAPLDSEVIGACDGLTLSTACDLLEEGLVELERMADRRVVRLCHEQSAAALLAGLAPEVVRTRHQRLAEAFDWALPGDSDARFVHWAAAGDDERAGEVALDSARALTRGLAFHRAAERYRWLLDHGADSDRRTVERELADVLGRSGDGPDAARLYETLASGGERDRFERLAAEQWLRAGEVERGRRLLHACLQRAGAELPETTAGCVRAVLQARREVRGLPLEAPPRSPSPKADDAIELAWTAGLGLNLVHLAESAVAQARFTALALKEGRPDQVGRALAVEYSYVMLTGGPGAKTDGEELRAAMERVGPSVDTATQAMMHLSTGAGEYFRGAHESAEGELTKASERYAGLLGARSWERANCEMYRSWVALERGELASVAASVPAQAELARERGDVLYRQCFHRGFGGTAWLIRDEPAELRKRLDDLPLESGTFQLPHFLDLVARVRLDLYEGADGWRRFEAAWPALRMSGQWLFRWPRYAIARLAVQAALGTGRARETRRWVRRLLLTNHPAARPWAMLATGLLEQRFRLVERAQHLFEQQGMTLGAHAAEHHLVGVDLPCARPNALLRAAALSLPE